MSSVNTSEDIQYLTFTLDNDQFAFPIARVCEVLNYDTVTRVPCMPEFLCGVINLRGHVVPVIDLRIKLGMEAAKKTVNTCIIIVELDIDGNAMRMGALADSVQAVIDLEQDQIEPSSRLGTRVNTEFILGIGKQNDNFIIILNIDRVLSEDELAVMQSSAEGLETDEDEKESDIEAATGITLALEEGSMDIEDSAARDRGI